MPESSTPTPGSPCWADLWTSDVEGARRFYDALFGWESTDPDPDFGGDFGFARAGAPIAGAMGDMGEMKATDTWKIHFATTDAEVTAVRATAKGASLFAPPMPVAEPGVQAVMTDPTGAVVGLWQPGIHRGFSALGVHGAPSGFELHTGDHDAAVAFYSGVFDLQPAVGDTPPPFADTMLRDRGGMQRVGIMDASAFLPDGVGSHWLIDGDVDDVDAAAARVRDLGGALVRRPDATPSGRIAAVADPAGARFQLRHPPAA